jgi:hypothetical protein
LQGTGSYAQQNNINLQQIVDATNQWIEIDQAIIQIGR